MTNRDDTPTDPLFTNAAARLYRVARELKRYIEENREEVAYRLSSIPPSPKQ